MARGGATLGVEMAIVAHPRLRLGAESSVEVQDGMSVELTEGGTLAAQDLLSTPFYTVRLMYPYLSEGDRDMIEDHYAEHRADWHDIDMQVIDGHVYRARLVGRAQVQKHDNAPRRWRVSATLMGSRLI